VVVVVVVQAGLGLPATFSRHGMRGGLYLGDNMELWDGYLYYYIWVYFCAIFWAWWWWRKMGCFGEYLVVVGGGWWVVWGRVHMRFAASDGDLEFFFSSLFLRVLVVVRCMICMLFGFECGLGCWSWVLWTCRYDMGRGGGGGIYHGMINYLVFQSSSSWAVGSPHSFVSLDQLFLLGGSPWRYLQSIMSPPTMHNCTTVTRHFSVQLLLSLP